MDTRSDLLKSLHGHHPLRMMAPFEQAHPFIDYVHQVTKQSQGMLRAIDATEVQFKAVSDKLRSKHDFYSALAEVETLVWLAGQNFAVTPEPFAPEKGPDLHIGIGGFEAFVEVRSLGPDAEETKINLAQNYVMERLRKTPSRYFISIHMKSETAAYSQQLKRAVRAVQSYTRELSERNAPSACLHQFADGTIHLWEGCNHREAVHLAAEQSDWELHRKMNDSKLWANYALINDEPRNYLSISPEARWLDTPGRLRTALHDKLDQLPVDHRSIIVVDTTNAGASQFDLAEALYGTTVHTFSRETLQSTGSYRRRDGFFTSTTRVQAVVMMNRSSGPVIRTEWLAFPTNNLDAKQRLNSAELAHFGEIFAGAEHLTTDRKIN